MLKQERQSYSLRQIGNDFHSPNTHLYAHPQKKIHSCQPFHVCTIQEIDTLITILRPDDVLPAGDALPADAADDPSPAPYIKAGVQVL